MTKNRIWKVLGIAFTLVSLGFLISLFVQEWGRLPDLDWGARLVVSLLLAVASSAASTFLIALIWKLALAQVRTDFSYSQALSNVSLTQIGKYLPGNIGNFVGRVELARKMGAERRLAIIALLFESICIFLASIFLLGFIFVTGHSLLNRYIPDELVEYTMSLGGVLILAVVVAPLIFHQCFRWMPTRLSVWFGISASEIVNSTAVYFVSIGSTIFSLALGGVSLFAVIFGLGETSELDLLTCISVFTSAWVIGYISPGSPGGIGVRDAILVAGLSPYLGPGGALTAAILHRIVSVGGEMIMFFGALILSSRAAKKI